MVVRVGRFAAVMVAAGALFTATQAVSAVSPIELDGSADAGATARRGVRTASPEAVDVVSIAEHGAMKAATIEQVERLADSLGVPSAQVRSFQYGLAAVRRGTRTIQEATGTGGRWQFPMAITAVPQRVVAPIFGAAAGEALLAGSVVMGRSTADLRGAQEGDVVQLVSSDGTPTSLTIGLIAPDAVVGGAELLMSDELADRLGVTAVTRVVLHGPFDRDDVAAAVRNAGFVDGRNVRIVMSWGPPNPDGTLGLAATKQLLGEFDFRIVNSQYVVLDPTWVAQNIPSSRELYPGVAVRARCHRLVRPHLQAALAEVAAAGLAAAIDLRNTNTYGGCWNPRYSRVSSVVGSLSRHAWGMAFDANTVTNAQGKEPPGMDCRVVRIFRKHGFAWGGNFLLADGMHFEFVGERRDQWPYPSEHCPNLPPEASASVQASWPAARDTMFGSSDGVADDGGH